MNPGAETVQSPDRPAPWVLGLLAGFIGICGWTWAVSELTRWVNKNALLAIEAAFGIVIGAGLLSLFLRRWRGFGVGLLLGALASGFLLLIAANVLIGS